MGNEQLIYLSLGSQTIIVRRPQTQNIEIGDKVDLSFSRNNMLFILENTGKVIETALHSTGASISQVQ
jgi:multiple sugar transport system ATP-binding protein